MRSGIVYVLRDPITGEAVYVGSTVMSPKQRLWIHRADAQRFPARPIGAWFNALRRGSGREPVFDVLERCPESALAARERAWTTQLREAGSDLLNARTAARGRKPRPVWDAIRARLLARLAQPRS